METKFYICRHCGNIVTFVRSSGVKVVCCGEEMQELVPNTVEASQEKHVPVISRDGGKVTVTVGSVPHPMLQEHFIERICLVTQSGRQVKFLKPGDEPHCEFCLSPGDEPIAAYAFCNLHGLWKQSL